MRQIKFRFWNEENNKMYPLMTMFNYEIGTGYILIDGTVVFVKTFDRGETFKVLSYPKGKLMQFTGLLDKNGKEIYESDIVLIEGRRTITIFKDGGFTFQWETDDHHFYHPTYSKDSEIIGNIYENPKLLK